jgi:TPR repeat protein
MDAALNHLRATGAEARKEGLARLSPLSHKAAEGGDSDAQLTVAHMFLQGHFVRVNYERVAHSISRAAQGNYVWST